jgi:hypothetical protein
MWWIENVSTGTVLLNKVAPHLSGAVFSRMNPDNQTFVCQVYKNWSCRGIIRTVLTIYSASVEIMEGEFLISNKSEN